MTFHNWITALLSTTVLLPGAADASVAAYLSAREQNSLGLSGSWEEDKALFSRRDCIDDIEVKLTITVSSDEDTDGRELYIYAGSNCDDSEDSEDCDEDVLRLDAKDTVVSLPVSFLIDTEDCTDSDSSSIWVGLLESEDEKEDNATWATPVDIDFEGELPASPESISVSPGENNLVVTWETDEDDDADPDGFLLVYARGESTADGGADGGVSEPVCSGPLFEGETISTDFTWVTVSSGSSTSGRIENLANDVFYQIAVVTVDEYGNPSPFSEVVCEEPGETVDFLEAYTALGGRANGDYCFVATAAFGDIDHPTVRILRRFRDEVLLRLPFGPAWVAWYYRVGPTLATEIDTDTVSTATRALLTTTAAATLVVLDFRKTFAFPIAAGSAALLLLLWTAFSVLGHRRIFSVERIHRRRQR